MFDAPGTRDLHERIVADRKGSPQLCEEDCVRCALSSLGAFGNGGSEDQDLKGLAEACEMLIRIVRKEKARETGIVEV
jgi:hypothetical protein